MSVAEWVRRAIQCGGYSEGQRKLVNVLESQYWACLRFYSNEKCYPAVRSVVPEEGIRARAREWMASSEHLFKCESDYERSQEAFVCSLMHWMKFEWFSWVDQPPCDFCTVREWSFSLYQPLLRNKGAYKSTGSCLCLSRGSSERFSAGSGVVFLFSVRFHHSLPSLQ
jgi:hypothetical protein